jgi:hypothetical protein
VASPAAAVAVVLDVDSVLVAVLVADAAKLCKDVFTGVGRVLIGWKHVLVDVITGETL